VFGPFMPGTCNSMFQWGSWWARREGKGTVDVLKFAKSCFGDEAVVVREVGGWKAGWEDWVRRVVEASHREKGDGVVRSDLVIVTLRRVVLMGVLYDMIDWFCEVG